MKLTALVITFNEENHIERCINSLKNVSDEIIVVDSYSTDKTPELCKKLEVNLIQNSYIGQIEQKNYALSQASYDYILSLDADEELTEDLAKSILKEKNLGFPYDGYSLHRLNNYAGRWVKHGGWHPEWKLRLWNKHKATWGGMNPHDVVYLQDSGQHKRLGGYLLHYAFESVAEHMARIDQYATIGAASLIDNGRSATLIHLILSPTIKFIRDYLLKLGFLDGTTGWQIARLSAKTKYLKYKKMLTLQHLAK